MGNVVWKLEPATPDPKTGGPYWWAIYEFAEGDDINGKSVAYIWPGSGFTYRGVFLAAPEQKDALIIAEYAVAQFLSDPSDLNREGLTSCLKKMRAAIAKAEGAQAPAEGPTSVSHRGE